jgi:phenylacetic acid degradation operon negative regulatory protein
MLHIANNVGSRPNLQYHTKCHNQPKCAIKIMIEIQPINARTLILDLVTTNQPPRYTIQQLLKGGEAMGIGASAMRTALSRLTREGQVENVERGLYGIGPQGRPLQSTLLSWRNHRSPPLGWNGAWLAAVIGAGDRADRTVWRRTLRTLRLRGFAEAEPNVWVRPDNITGGLDALRATLAATGGASGLLLLEATGLDPGRESEWRRLWNVPDMQARYKEMKRRMTKSTARLEKMALADAAAETLLIGRTGVRILHFDPGLPEELCPSVHRRAMTETMIAYNQLGTRLWFRLLGID